MTTIAKSVAVDQDLHMQDPHKKYVPLSELWVKTSLSLYSEATNQPRDAVLKGAEGWEIYLAHLHAYRELLKDAAKNGAFTPFHHNLHKVEQIVSRALLDRRNALEELFKEGKGKAGFKVVNPLLANAIADQYSQEELRAIRKNIGFVHGFVLKAFNEVGKGYHFTANNVEPDHEILPHMVPEPTVYYN
jgi:hypothetical protein